MIPASSATVATPAPLRLRNGTLINGTGRPARENATVIVRDGRICYIGADAGWAAPPSSIPTSSRLRWMRRVSSVSMSPRTRTASTAMG